MLWEVVAGTAVIRGALVPYGHIANRPAPPALEPLVRRMVLEEAKERIALVGQHVDNASHEAAAQIQRAAPANGMGANEWMFYSRIFRAQTLG